MLALSACTSRCRRDVNNTNSRLVLRLLRPIDGFLRRCRPPVRNSPCSRSRPHTGRWEAAVSAPEAAASAALAGAWPPPLMMTLVWFSSETSNCPELSCGVSSDSQSLLSSLSHSDSPGSLGSLSDSAVFSGGSFSLSFWACASLECRHFMRRFWNQTFTCKHTSRTDTHETRSDSVVSVSPHFIDKKKLTEKNL